ncbi:TOMM precursor leader peptide-binding protein, partial [Streptomyces toxytricini]
MNATPTHAAPMPGTPRPGAAPRTTQRDATALPAAAPHAEAPAGLPVLDVEAALATGSGCAVVHLDSWTLESAERLSRHALAHPVRLVPVREDGGLTVVGPVLEPAARACLVCTEYQRLASAGGRVPWRSPRLRLGGTGTPALAEGALMLAAGLLGEAGPPDGDGATPSATVYVVQGGRATWSAHRVRPVGGCPVCRPL